jgi:hypothetical protein
MMSDPRMGFVCSSELAAKHNDSKNHRPTTRERKSERE